MVWAARAWQASAQVAWQASAQVAHETGLGACECTLERISACCAHSESGHVSLWTQQALICSESCAYGGEVVGRNGKGHRMMQELAL